MRPSLAMVSLLVAFAAAPQFAGAQSDQAEESSEGASAAEEEGAEPEAGAPDEATEPDAGADSDSDEEGESATEGDADADSSSDGDTAEPDGDGDSEADIDADSDSDEEADVVPHGGDELPPEMAPQVVDDTEPTGEPEATARPMRIVGRLGVGGALRLVSHDDFQQDTLAPSYLNLQGQLVLPLAGTLRHSVLVGASTNLESDGSFVTGVDPFQQWVIEAGYGLHVPFGRPGAPTWVVGGHVSAALVASPDLTWGFEVGGDAAYHFLAGLGVYAELAVGTYFGAEDRFGNLTANPLLALEVGLTWDYEVLP